MAGSAKPDSSTRCVCFPLGGAGVSRARLASGLCRFRPADVACLLSASNRRADIVRATPIRSIAESRREGYDTFRLADAKQQAFTQRPFVGLSPKQPVSASVAPGLRTMRIAPEVAPPLGGRQPKRGSQCNSVSSQGAHDTAEPGLMNTGSQSNMSAASAPGLVRSRQAADLSICKASQEGENRADGLTARRCVNDTGSPSLPVSRTIRNRRNCPTLFHSSRATSNMKSHRNAGQIKLRGKRSKALSCGCCDVRDLRFEYFQRLDRQDCLTLSPRPPDQSGDPAHSYRIGAVLCHRR